MAKLDIITLVVQILAFVIFLLSTIVTSVLEKDYNLTDTNSIITGFYIVIIIFSLLYIYRILITFFMCFFFTFFYQCYFCFVMCTIPCRNSNSLSKMLIFLIRIVSKFFCGRLDFFHLFFCFQNCMPSSIDDIQPILDILSMVLDTALIVSVFVLGALLSSQMKPNGNPLAAIFLFLQCIPLIIIIIINIIRFKRSRKVSARVRDIFRPDGININKKAKIVLYEDALGGKECTLGTDCLITDPEHRVKYHKRTDIFKLTRFNESGAGNITVGYHQTSIENIRNIIVSYMRESGSGLLGSGIYFATNLEATDSKARQKGAILVAEIDLGKVDELNLRPLTATANQIADGFNTKYLHHPRGPHYDEFIIRNADQIKQYVVVVSKDAVKLYRDTKTMVIFISIIVSY